MARARASVVAPWIALLLVLSLSRTLSPSASARAHPGARSEPVAAIEAPASQAAACGIHDCGCPHEVVDASCCCADRASGASARRALRIVVVPPPALTPARGQGLPTPTLEAFHCSGGKHGRSSANTRIEPVASLPPTARLVFAVQRGWVAKNEPGPLYDLRREPTTPPPRPDPRA